MRLISSALTALVLATPALASGPGETPSTSTQYLSGGILTYDLFEASVAHTDLEYCPAEFDPDAVFCRLTLANEMANIFVFSYDGDFPLLAVKHYELNDEFLPF